MAVPLVAKMAAEFDGDNRDGNYFLGIRPGDAVLVADLEEGAKGVAPGTNHPITGVTVVTSNTWHHAAVTYNGTNWALFLDGQLESTLVIVQPPRVDTIQHAGLASSLNSSGGPQGFFAGMLDEVRIWKYARSAAEISAATEAIDVVTLAALGVDPTTVGATGSPTWVAGVEQVDVSRRGEMIDGDSVAAQAARFS
jgi:hypothetical protein